MNKENIKELIFPTNSEFTVKDLIAANTAISPVVIYSKVKNAFKSGQIQTTGNQQGTGRGRRRVIYKVS